MKKNVSSQLSNQQLQQLAHQVLDQNDQTVVDNWMARMAHPQCVPNYFRQDMINFITVRAGREPDEIVKGMIERAAAPKPTHAPPTSAPPAPPKRQYLVAMPCFVCGKNTSDTEERIEEAQRAGRKIFCSDACQQKQLQGQAKVGNELVKFLNEVGDSYYDCDYNGKLLMAHLAQNNQTMTADNLFEAFLQLRGQLFTTLTPEQIGAMTDVEFARRAKLKDSDSTGIMGGVDLNTMKKRPETIVHSSNAMKFYQMPQTGVRP